VRVVCAVCVCMWCVWVCVCGVCMCVCVWGVCEILREEYRQRMFENRVLRRISLICDKSVTTQNLALLSYWYRKKLLQMHFYRYSVITQLAKLAAGEQLCRPYTHKNL